jgi:hypothetical protein
MKQKLIINGYINISHDIDFHWHKSRCSKYILDSKNIKMNKQSYSEHIEKTFFYLIV